MSLVALNNDVKICSFISKENLMLGERNIILIIVVNSFILLFYMSRSSCSKFIRYEVN